MNKAMTDSAGEAGYGEGSLSPSEKCSSIFSSPPLLFFLSLFFSYPSSFSYFFPSISLSLSLSSLSHVASRASHVPLPTFKTPYSSSFRQTNFSVNFFRSQKNNNHNLCICTHHCHHPYSGHMERGKVS